MTPHHVYDETAGFHYMETQCSFSRSLKEEVSSFTVIKATIANHNNSFAHGVRVETGRDNQAVFGQYNKVDSSALFIIGNGDNNTPKNAFVITDDNKAYIDDKQILVKGDVPTKISEFTDAKDYVEKVKNSADARESVTIERGFMSSEMSKSLVFIDPDKVELRSSVSLVDPGSSKTPYSTILSVGEKVMINDKEVTTVDMVPTISLALASDIESLFN